MQEIWGKLKCIIDFIPIIVLFKVSPALCSNEIKQASEFDESVPIFSKNEYPENMFKTTQKSYTHGKLIITLIQVKIISNFYADDKGPLFCDAWIEIRKDNRIINRIRGGIVDPVGWHYGLFVPQKQPSPKYFAIIKEGDYDGRLILINTEGKVLNTVGGRYFATEDRKYLLVNTMLIYLGLL